MNNSKTIYIAAAIIINETKEMLLVRKQNSCFFMQAGGKIETGETPQTALIRELQEELNLDFHPDQLSYCGKYIATAANEKDHVVNAHLFTINLNKTNLKPEAELAEVGWYSIEQAKNLMLAPLTKDIILPIVEKYFVTN